MTRRTLPRSVHALLVLVVTAGVVAVGLPWPVPAATAREAEGPYQPRVTGRVTGPDGEPVFGAELRIGREVIRKYTASVTGWSRQPDATTDGAGTFDFRASRKQSVLEFNGNLWIGDELWISVAAPGHAPRHVRLPQTGDDQVQVDVELDAGVVLSGVVVDDSGRPRSGTVVELLSPRGTATHETYPPQVPYLPAPLATPTDEEGRFEFSMLPEATFRVRATDDGFLAPERLVQASSSVRVSMLRPITAAGQVVDEGGLPVRASLRWRHVDALPEERRVAGGFTFSRDTDPDGSFALQNVAPGRWTVHVVPLGRDLPASRLSVELDGEEDARMELPPAHPWSGRLLDSAGVALGGRHLTLHTVADPTFIVSHALTADDGRFTLWRTDDGLHAVELRPDGVKVSGFEPAEALDIRLPGTGTLDLVLPDEISVRAALTPIRPPEGLTYSYAVHMRGGGPDSRRRFTYLADVDHELRVEPATAFGMLTRYERVGPATRVVPAGTTEVSVEYRPTDHER